MRMFMVVTILMVVVVVMLVGALMGHRCPA
jgi:hypothetical protein